MNVRKRASLLGAFVVIGAWTGVARAQPLTVEDAVAVALRDNPRLRAARARLRGADDSHSAASRRRLPALRVSEELQRYDKPFAISFPLPGAAMVPPAPPFVARERTTNTFVVSADQPVLGLGRLSEEAAALDESGAATEAEVAAAEAGVRQAVELTFLRHFEARALEEIAQSSTRELGDQLEVGRARLTSGVVTEADVLRVEVALANARQQQIAAHSDAEIARVNVLALLGRGEEASVTLVVPTGLLAENKAVAPSLVAANEQARHRRPELAIDAHRAEAAAHVARAHAWALAPEVDLEAAYLRVDGQVFTPKNSGYVGVRAQWGIWNWGADWKQRAAALAQADAARLEGEDRVHQIEAELAGSFSQAQAARAAVAAARTAIAGAEEAYRETDAQVKAGTATTTDLLAAQSALSQARLNFTRAQYALASAGVQLRHAMGE